MWEYNNSPELYHHGVKGQKWGVRRYQNADGTLTSAGKKRAEQYRSRELDRVNKKYDTTRFDARIEKNLSKYRANPSEMRRKRIVNDAFTSFYKRGMGELERSKLNKMSLAEIDQERVNVGKKKVGNVVSIAGTITMASLIGVGVGSTTNISAYKTNSRVTKKQQADIVELARKHSTGMFTTKPATATSSAKPQSRSDVSPEEESAFWKALAAEYGKDRK